jgi:hypothetical protein
MTFERIERAEAALHGAPRRLVLPAGIGSEARPSPLGQWLRALVLKRSANAMLRRLLHRQRPTNIEELSPYLLRDLGLPPDIRR